MVTEEDLYIGDLPAGTIDISADFIPFGDTSDSKKAKRMLPSALKTALDLDEVDNTSDIDKPVSTLQAAADLAAENNAKAYADTLVVGLLDDRGNFDASGNAFPSSGGSGTAGAIKKGDLWTISVAGTLGGVAVTIGDVIRALSDTPGQTASNWNITENNLGFVPENSENKSTNIDTDKLSNTKYGAVKAIYDWATGLFATIANLLLKTDKLITANRQTASYTLVIGDADKLVEMNNASANNLTVPPNSSVAFSVGTQIIIAQYGAGQTTVVAGSGVTIRSSGGKLKLTGQYSGGTLIKIATDEWYLFGDIAS